MRYAFIALVLVTIMVATPVAAQNQQAVEVTDEAIDRAIDRAVAWLWTQQEPNGLWPHKLRPPDARGIRHSATGSRWPPGEHAMAMTALEYAGVPVDDKRFQKGLKLLLEMDLKKNYIISSRVVMLAHLYHHSEKKRRSALRRAMKQDVDQLVANQGKIGGWRYGGPPSPPRAIDFSNTQLCVLALSEAAKCGVEVPQEAMLRAHKRIIEDQKDDGGWNYGEWSRGGQDKASYGNMTAACVASLFLTNEFLTGGLGCPCKRGKSSRGKDIVGDALDRGMEWLDREFLPNRSPKGYHYYYWIYQAERVGIATGYRYFGTHDWYREICGHLLGLQGGGGNFGNTVSTSFAILFLVKGRAPILFNKLQYKGDWNLHRFDMKNLAAYMGRAKEQRIAWQVIQSTTPVNLWYDAPIMFVTTEQKFEMTDELKAKLRAYTDGGGTLLIEASCGNGFAKNFWKTLAKEVWPEWELKRVDKDHPVWEADTPMRGRKPNLMHMHDGVRSIIFYSPSDISCTWHTNGVAKGRGLFQFGVNVAAYASDKGKLRRRLTGSRIVAGRGLEGTTPSGGSKTTLKLGRLKHGGDWYVGRNYGALGLLGDFVKETAGITLAVQAEVDPAAESDLGQFDLLWMRGRQGLSLGDAAKTKLKDYLSSGGFLVAESVVGDTRFTDAATALAAELGLAAKPLATTDGLINGQLGAAAGYDLSAKVRFSRALAVKRIGKNFAPLTGLYLGDRLVGILSPYDVLYSLTGCRAYDRLGYAPDHAMALATNIVLRASAQGAAGTEETPAEAKPEE